MKKIFVLMLIFAVLTVSAYAGNTEAVFNPQNYSVEISLETPLETDEMFTISIWEGTEDIPGDKTAHFAGLYMTENGKLSEEILIPYTLKSGKNTILTDSVSQRDAITVLTLNPKDASSVEAAKAAVQIKKSGEMYDFLVKEKNGLLLGIDTDDENILSVMSGICDILVSEADAVSADDPISFYNAFAASHGMYLIKNGSDADEVFEKYGIFMGIDYEEYSSQSSDVKAKVIELMKKADVSGKGISSVYAGSLLLSGVTLCDNLEDFIGKTEKNAASLGIDMGEGSEFSKISESLRYKVFVKMFEKRDSFASFKDVADSFSKNVADVLASVSSSSSSSGSGGGSSSGKKVSVSGGVSLPSVPVYPPADSQNQTAKNIFSDIGGHYSEEYVNSLASKNIINGYSDGTFKPDNLVTRAEFAKILTTALNLEAKGEPQNFADVTHSDWYYAPVGAMSMLGFINGYNGVFAPDNILTRQDAAVIAVRILSYFGAELQNTDIGFEDASDISDYASDSVKIASSCGIMTGSDSYFRPLDGIKRGEVAIVAHRIMKQTGR